VVAGVPPAGWFLFGVVNPNAGEIALVLLSWVGVALVGGHRARSRDLAWISVPATLAVIARPVALLPACAIAVATSALVERSTWRNRLALWGPLAIGAATVLAWNRAVALEFDDPRTAQAAGVAGATWRAVKEVPATLSEAVGALSWTEISAPWPARALSAVVAVTLLTTACFSGSSRLRVALGAWLTVLVLGPVVCEVLTHHRIGFIWQGRYSISTYVGVGPLAALAARAELQRRAADPSAACVRAAGVVSSTPVTSTLVGMAAVAEGVAFWTVLRRYTVGTNGSWWFAGELGWDPAVHPRVLLGVHLGVLVCVLAASVVATRTPTGRSTRRRR
jgi:hypothetical protein